MSDDLATTELIKKMDNVLGYVSSINDERDSVPILIEVRKLWSQIKLLLMLADLKNER